jgi:hypothetical protein
MTPGFRVPSSPALPVSSSSSASPLSRLVPTVTRLGVTVRGVEPLATSAEPAVSRLGAAARPLGALVSGPVPAVSPVGGTVSRLVPTVSAFVPAARCLVPAVSRRQKAANRLKINDLRSAPGRAGLRSGDILSPSVSAPTPRHSTSPTLLSSFHCFG